MKEIGFKNFRKFDNFPNMPFAPITILVGGNNAGKSTVVKAILSVLSFLRPEGNSNATRYIVSDKPSDEIWKPQFYFNRNYFAHVGTFDRAINNNHHNDNITFSAVFQHAEIKIEVRESKKKNKDVNVVYGDVQSIQMNCFMPNVDIVFDLTRGEVTATFHSSKNQRHYIKEPKLPLDNKDRAKDIITRYNNRIETYEKYYAGMKGKDIVIKANLQDSYYFMDGSPIQSLTEFFFNRFEKSIMNDDYSGLFLPFVDIQPLNIEASNLKYLKKKQIRPVMMDFISLGRSIRFQQEFENVEYIYAHAATQAVVYSAKDKGDYVSSTIHSFADLNINSESRSGSKKRTIHDRFIQYWMKQFKIGDDYNIQSVGGESHTVKIIENGKEVYLSDKGMGSIQIMILLFRLATLILEGNTDTTIIIEEPEQNLHPFLQSELAKLFFELQNKYNLKLIVETHSEYLVRMCQVIVGDKFKNEEDTFFAKKNPFKVYYFTGDEKRPYYDMELTKVGGFKQKFGQGFFNEAGRLDTIVTNNKYDSL